MLRSGDTGWTGGTHHDPVNNAIWSLAHSSSSVCKFLFSVLVLSGSYIAAEPAKTDVVKLFNGHDLQGWTTWLVDTQRRDPRGVFGVRGGTIRISGDGFGYLATKQEYSDYRLVAQFRWGDRNWRGRQGKARDSGIFLHATGPDGNSYDGNGAFMAAIECQVMQGSVGDLMLIKGRDAAGRSVPVEMEAQVRPKKDADGWPYWLPNGNTLRLRQTGRLNWLSKDPQWQDRLDFHGAHDVETGDGKWCRVECVCSGDSVEVFVNGTLVNRASRVVPSRGKILLQCEGSEVFFRTVKLYPLQASGKPK